MGHVLLFGFRGPKARSTLRYFNARGRQSRPCAILRRPWRLRIYAPLGARPRRAVCCAGLRFGFGCKPEAAASIVLESSTFSFSKQTSSLIHSVAPPRQTATAAPGSGLGPPLRGGLLGLYQGLHLFLSALGPGGPWPPGPSYLKYLAVRRRQRRKQLICS